MTLTRNELAQAVLREICDVALRGKPHENAWVNIMALFDRAQPALTEQVATLTTERDAARIDRDAAIERAEQAEAAAAAMREAIIEWEVAFVERCHRTMCDDQPPQLAFIDATRRLRALPHSTDAGAAMLERVRRLEEFAQHACDDLANIADAAELRQAVIVALTILNREPGPPTTGTMAALDGQEAAQ